jgi:hypothetical protein
MFVSLRCFAHEKAADGASAAAGRSKNEEVSIGAESKASRRLWPEEGFRLLLCVTRPPV